MRRSRSLLLVSVLTLVIGLLPQAPADAAGMQTHAWMAVKAIDQVQDPQLKTLLDANKMYVYLGSRFPDTGYFPGHDYGETAHWQRFHDAYLDILKNKPGCGDLTAPTGPCADDIAFLFGIIGHGTGDEVWDWLFEPYSPDLDEYYESDDFLGLADGGGQELTMDLVALGIYGVGAPKPMPPLPSVGDLSQAFTDSGQPGIPTKQFTDGQGYVELAQDVEQGWAAKHLSGVLANMPWMSHNMLGGPGGVEYAATAIAGQWDHQWSRLLDRDEPVTISNHYPASDARGIPPVGWDRATFQPGSGPGRGGAATRIAISLTDALPFGRPGGPPASTELAPGSLVLTEDETGLPVLLKAGYPKVVPYGPDSGTHTAALQPAANLEPCTWYRVSTTDLLLDADGDQVTPISWRFRTGLDAAGTRCADDPAAPPTTGFPTTTPSTTAPEAATTTTANGSGPVPGPSGVGPIGTASPAAPVRGNPTYTG